MCREKSALFRITGAVSFALLIAVIFYNAGSVGPRADLSGYSQLRGRIGRSGADFRPDV